MKPAYIIAFLVVAALGVLGGYGLGMLKYQAKYEQQQQQEPQPSPNESNVKTVKLFYYDPSKDEDATGNILCSKQGLAAVTRNIPITKTPIQDTIKLLLEGNLTPSEKAQGITTEYPLPGVQLISAYLNNGVLTVTLSDPQNKTSGGSCRAGILWFQIESTAKQFPEVQQVKFQPETLFQP